MLPLLLKSSFISLLLNHLNVENSMKSEWNEIRSKTSMHTYKMPFSSFDTRLKRKLYSTVFPTPRMNVNNICIEEKTYKQINKQTKRNATEKPAKKTHVKVGFDFMKFIHRRKHSKNEVKLQCTQGTGNSQKIYRPIDWGQWCSQNFIFWYLREHVLFKNRKYFF